MILIVTIAPTMAFDTLHGDVPECNEAGQAAVYLQTCSAHQHMAVQQFVFRSEFCY